MPMSPNAPNYIGEVRGIVDDLRNNYIKKQQLYLQAQEQEGRLGLSVANAAQQASLAQAQLSASNQQHQANAAVQMAQHEAQKYTAAAALAQKQANQDLNERKYQLDLWKEKTKLEEEERKRKSELDSGKLLQEGLIAVASPDKTKLIEWTNKMAGAQLSGSEQNNILSNVMTLVNSKKKLEQDEVNIRTQPDALQIVQDLNKMDVSGMSPDELSARMDEHTKKFKNLGNTDAKINDIFISVSQDVAKRQHDFRQKDYGLVMDSFLRNGNLAQLDTDTQKQYDKLQQDYPEGEARASQDYSNKLQRLMYQSNLAKSSPILNALTSEKNAIEENIITQNPSLAAIKVDPKTGEKYKTFPYSGPDLSPIVGFNGTIDPDTGLVNKSTLKAYEKWKAEVTSPTFLLGQVPFIRGLNMGAPAAPSPADKQQVQEAAVVPFRPSTPFTPIAVSTPGTATIPTAPGAPKATLSEETVLKVVNLYNSNPEALVNGRPIKDIVARMISSGITLPGLRQTPQSAVVNQGQKR
jgi:hypothetical protein